MTVIRRLMTRSGRNCEGGQTLVEFALISLVFFTLMLGVVDLGRVIWHYNALSNAAREGARNAVVLHESGGTVVMADCAGVVAQMQSLGLGLDLDAADVSLVYGSYTNNGTTPAVPASTQTCSTVGRQIRDGITVMRTPPSTPTNAPYYVIVRATFQFQPVTPLIGSFFGPSGQISLQAISTMVTQF